MIAELLHYTIYYTDRVDRVEYRVFDVDLSEMCLKCVCAENGYYTVYHTVRPNRVFIRVLSWNFFFLNRRITRPNTRVT